MAKISKAIRREAKREGESAVHEAREYKDNPGYEAKQAKYKYRKMRKR